jgi:conjugal transfer pilus assembly protein TraI
MFKWLFSQKPQEAQRAVPAPVVPPTTRALAPTVPVYPPMDTGIEFASVDNILSSQQSMLGRLRILAGGNDEHYKKYYETVVRNLAAYIQLLPASKSDTHAGAGGLLRLCLEVGFFAQQSSERVMFAGQATVELRRELEPRWRYATFLAALCCELYRPLSDMVVTDKDGNEWTKHLKPLTTWGEERGADRYFVQWNNAKPLHTLVSGRADVAVLMGTILPDYVLQYLADGSSEIVPVVFAVASGSAHPSDSPVAKLVSETRDKIYKRDTAVRKDNYGKLTVGNHLEPYLLDAMRHLYRNGTWKINGQKSRLWLSGEGLYLIWKSGAKELLKTVADQGVSGVPNEIATLAEILCDAKIAERNGKSPYWLIVTPESTDEWQCIKIANPISVLEEDEIGPVTITVKRDVTAGPKPPTQSPVAADVPGANVRATAKATADVRPAPIDAQRDLTALEGEAETRVAAAAVSAPSLGKTPNGEPASALGGTAATDTPNQNPIAQGAPQIPSEVDGTAVAKVVDVPAPAHRPKGESATKDEEAEIIPASKQRNYIDNVPERARAVLKADVQEVIGKMVDDYRKGRSKQSILDTPQGIAFENQQILRYGLSFERLVGLLHANDWLVTPEGNPNAKNIKVPGLDGKNITCVVIKRSAAEFLGFLQSEEE